MISSTNKFINYWYNRYLLITELYMVEKWERAMFHLVFLIMFFLVFAFNATVTLASVSWVVDFLYGGKVCTTTNKIFKTSQFVKNEF